MTDEHCLFCKISAGTIPARIVYEDSEVLAFDDINPQAPIHVLIIPRAHISSMQTVASEHEMMLGKLLHRASLIAKEKQLETGYRLVINCLQDGGQEVFHLHVHLLGGRQFTWPPG